MFSSRSIKYSWQTISKLKSARSEDLSLEKFYVEEGEFKIVDTILQSLVIPPRVKNISHAIWEHCHYLTSISFQSQNCSLSSNYILLLNH
jgi:hypothetical protein